MRVLFLIKAYGNVKQEIGILQLNIRRKFSIRYTSFENTENKFIQIRLSFLTLWWFRKSKKPPASRKLNPKLKKYSTLAKGRGYLKQNKRKQYKIKTNHATLLLHLFPKHLYLELEVGHKTVDRQERKNFSQGRCSQEPNHRYNKSQVRG